MKQRPDETQKTCGAYETASAKMLSEVRNGLQTCVESIDEYLNFLGKVVLNEWDPDSIQWIETEGSKGFYEKAEPQGSEDFIAMLRDLEAHSGKMTRDGYFYWIFQDQETVGRKKRQ